MKMSEYILKYRGGQTHAKGLTLSEAVEAFRAGLEPPLDVYPVEEVSYGKEKE